jgi:trk system potassium uptake protein TrkA
VEITLPAGSPCIGKRVGDVSWPTDATLSAILRDGQVITPTPDHSLEAGDELLFVATTESEPLLQAKLAPRHA